MVTFQATTALHELVEDVEAAFRFAADYHPTLLEEIPVNVGTCDTAIWRETDADELSESTGVVVPLRLRITERFEDGIGLQDLSLKKTKAALGS